MSYAEEEVAPAYAAPEVERPYASSWRLAMKRLWLSTALGALAMSFAAGSVSAAPMNGMKAGDAAASHSSLIEQVRHRCHWYRGELYCPRHGYRRHYQHYGSPYDDGYYGPYYGSGFYGPRFYGPGFGLYFGGRGHHRHW